MSKQKTKGKQFENKIASILHEFLYTEFTEYAKFLSEINSDLSVKRNSNSGATINDDGDIDLNLGKKYFPYSIECKFWKKFQDLNIFNINKSSVLPSVYKKQALPAAKNKNLKPIIIFQANRTLPMVFFDNKLLNLNLYNIDYYIKLSNNFYICFLVDFLQLHKPKGEGVIS